MPDLWMPGATRLDVGDHAPTDGGPAKAISHVTWDRNGTKDKPLPLVSFETLTRVFSVDEPGMAPHLLWDPFTGRFVQFFPANSRSKSVVDLAGGTRTNRAGSVVLQVEALFFPWCEVNGTSFERLVDTPCAGWAQLNAWIRSWGVPDKWPMGRPVDFTPHRSEQVWETHAGWYAHAHVPENTHTDPGSWPAFVEPPTPQPVTRPTVSLAHVVAAARRDPGLPQGGTTHHDEVVLVERALNAEGLLPAQYARDGSFGSKTISAYAAWQRHLGYAGSAADGIPGHDSLARLGARHGFTVTA